MIKWILSFLAKLLGFNPSFTPKNVIVDQMNEPRPLPMGRREFLEWSDRIIYGAVVPTEDGLTMHDAMPHASEENLKKLKIFKESQQFALANSLLHLGPTESHKPDAFFIHSLRKFAINQVADTIRVELREIAKARIAKDEGTGGPTKGTAEAVV